VYARFADKPAAAAVSAGAEAKPTLNTAPAAVERGTTLANSCGPVTLWPTPPCKFENFSCCAAHFDAFAVKALLDGLDDAKQHQGLDLSCLWSEFQAGINGCCHEEGMPV